MATNICRAGPGLMNSIRTSPPHLKMPRQFLVYPRPKTDTDEPGNDVKVKKTRRLSGKNQRGP